MSVPLTYPLRGPEPWEADRPAGACLDHRCNAACVPAFLSVHQMGGCLVPYGPRAPDHPDGYLPRACPSDTECMTLAAWAARNFPTFPQIRLAPRPGESGSAAARRVAREAAVLARRPNVSGGYTPNREWGWVHTYLGDGTLVTFYPAGERWRWEAANYSAVVATIEAGREAAAAVLGVSVDMTPERYAAIMGWDQPRCLWRHNHPLWNEHAEAHFDGACCAKCRCPLVQGQRYWHDTGTDAHVVWHWDCQPTPAPELRP